jgi:hypothetical protein
LKYRAGYLYISLLVSGSLSIISGSSSHIGDH